MGLMKRKDRKSPFRLLSNTEFQHFGKRNIGGPTGKDFHVQLVGSLACHWNSRATTIFAKTYIKMKGPIRRKNASAKAQVLVEHTDKGLGAEGMSGDKLDHYGGHHHYVVGKLNWRSDEVTEVLRALDVLVLMSHWSSAGVPRAEKFPHVWLDPNRVEERDPVRNLPLNFYRPEWLETLDRYKCQELNMGKAVKLTLPPRVLQVKKTALEKERGPGIALDAASMQDQ
ncbi:hypothetical protein EI94DRAFT_1707222 [Lactarius quietus]|nr:hypothetical protein EI94DRAFT_1707222 [Lactarius quietus]